MSVHIKRVLISDAVGQACVDLLRGHGFEVTCKYGMTPDQLVQEIKGYDALIVRSDTKVTREVLAASPSLRAVGRAGTGVDNIDIDAATKKGIIVLNTPGANSTSACELTCCLISCLARHVAQANHALREGRWDRKLYTGSELAGKTLAVLGLGRIGREVALRMQAFGMQVIGFDPLVSFEAVREFNVQKMELEQIWPLADYITVHTPLIPQTRNLINNTVLSKCKQGVKIINVARGGIVDEVELLEAIKDGRCGGAALDVFTEEPPKSPHTLELIQHPKVVATPHLGASTAEAQQRVAVEVAEQMIALTGSTQYSLSGVVNAPVLAASMNPENEPWIQLAKELGKIVTKMIHGVFRGVKIHIETSGGQLEGKRFLSPAVLLGMLTGHTENGLNLINAPALASDAGVQVSVTHDADNTRSALNISIGSHQVQGTVGDNGQLYLSRVNQAVFQPAVLLSEHLVLHLFSAQTQGCHLAALVTQLAATGADIASVNTATDKYDWYAVATRGLVTGKISVPGIVAI